MRENEYKKKNGAARSGKNDIGDVGIETDESLIYGRNAVIELLRSGKTVNKIFLRTGSYEGSLTVIVAEARSAGVPIVEVAKEKLDKLTGGANHQGVAASVADIVYAELDDLFGIAAERGEPPFFVIADGIEDPHNLGAIIRCAEGAGAHGVIIAKRRNCLVTPTVVKASAGAIEHMAVARVGNIAAAIDELKKRGVWIYGAEADGTSVYDADLSGAVAYVVGSEGNGLSRLVREKCDFVLSIPMYGKVNSFNASCAAAVILCAAARARHKI